MYICFYNLGSVVAVIVW